MRNEIVVPFGLDTNGMILTTQDPAVQAMQHVHSLVATRPGERVMLPTYGVKEYTFGPDPSVVSTQIQQEVTRQLATWEPSLQIDSIRSGSSDSDGVAQIAVDFTTDPTQTANIQTATVMVGGTVVQDVVA